MLDLATLTNTLPEALREEVYAHLFTALKSGELQVAVHDQKIIERVLEVTGLYLETDSYDDRSGDFGISWRPVVALEVSIRPGGKRYIELSF